MASENFAPHAHAGMSERGLEQQPTTNRFGTLWIPPYRGVAISDCRHPRTTSSDGWIRLHESDLLLQPLGQADVVRIHAGDILPAGLCVTHQPSLKKMDR
jgi:hypothetical protein